MDEDTPALRRMRNAVGDINSLEIDLDAHLQLVAEVVIAVRRNVADQAREVADVVDVEMRRVREQMALARDRLARTRA